MKKVEVKLEDRYWAEPHIVSLYLRDEKGIFEVWRWYIAGDTVLECYETEQERECQGFNLENEDVFETVVRAIKCILQKFEEEITAEIETNSETLKEKIAAIVSKLSI